MCARIHVQLYLIFIYKLLPTFQIPTTTLGFGSQKENCSGQILHGTVSGFLIQNTKLLFRKTVDSQQPHVRRSVALWHRAQARTVSFLPKITSFSTPPPPANTFEHRPWGTLGGEHQIRSENKTDQVHASAPELGAYFLGDGGQ